MGLSELLTELSNVTCVDESRDPDPNNKAVVLKTKNNNLKAPR